MAIGSERFTDGEVATRIAKYKEMVSQNKRREYLGVRVNCLDFNSSSFFGANSPWYIRGNSFGADLVRCFVGGEVFSRLELWKMLRRSRTFLSRRFFDKSVGDVCVDADCGGDVVSVLDMFPALKHSYSSPLPGRVVSAKRGLGLDSRPVSFLDFCCDVDGFSKKARFHDLSRSGSIRLDPVDSMRQLFLYRRRIQRCISWGYAVGLVPLMMTVTIFHRWHPLRGLLNVLRDAWNDFFTASTAAVKRSRRMGLVGYIRRAEETINIGGISDEGRGYNAGWHPHYHVILFVPASKVSVVASMEEELRDAWFRSVSKFFLKEFGEVIDSTYSQAFHEHGLFFSKAWRSGGGRDDHFYQEKISISVAHEMSTIATLRDRLTFISELSSNELYTHPATRARTQRFRGNACILRHVDDSYYMAKVMGCSSPSVYCGDNEMTSTHSKSSRVPFDLLLEDTAENNDLWVEYALATKGVRSFIFSHGLESCVSKYFEEHPDKDPIKPFDKSSKVVAQLDTRLYKIVEHSFKIDEMMVAAAKGYDVLCQWFQNFYVERGIPVSQITEDMYPLPPGSRSPFGDILEVPSAPEVSCAPSPTMKSDLGLSLSDVSGMSYEASLRYLRERVGFLVSHDIININIANAVISSLDEREATGHLISKESFADLLELIKASVGIRVDADRKEQVERYGRELFEKQVAQAAGSIRNFSSSVQGRQSSEPVVSSSCTTRQSRPKPELVEYAGMRLTVTRLAEYRAKYQDYLREFNLKYPYAPVIKPKTEERFIRDLERRRLDEVLARI